MFATMYVFSIVSFKKMEIQHFIHHRPCHFNSLRRAIESIGAEDVKGTYPVRPMVANFVSIFFTNLVLMSTKQRFQTHVECALKPMVEYSELCSSSSSTYGCMECKFFLHKSCMKSFPRQLINHRIHPCTLIFITDPYGNDEYAFCGERIVHGMKFSRGPCVFDLHVKCALLPTIDSEDVKEVQHFSHPHTLALVQNDEEYGSEPHCVACAQIC
ncbi:hypothetical protein ES332_A13G012500v1 [Gossypium tomentosum]|uniref:DC1 domain-containing protein n=1 Tax=Gossypium tomentosum TaxID=34277 RepID=A0A5D2MET4_GOSTO|nr:hypothetical protein ES332_A13G012500v1 [Gossypium tomentosum]